MTAVRRTALPDGWFHVYSRGAAGIELCPEDADKGKLLALIRRGERKFALEVLAGVVMSTHFHLVVEGRQLDLSRAIQWVKAIYARDFNRRRRRFGAVFAERFSCRAIDTEERLANACAYVRANPIKAGLCKSIEDWPWGYGSWRVESLSPDAFRRSWSLRPSLRDSDS